MPPDGAAGQLPTKNLILAGEPETFSDYAHPYHMVSKRKKGLSKFIKLWSYRQCLSIAQFLLQISPLFVFISSGCITLTIISFVQETLTHSLVSVTSRLLER